MTFRKAHIYTGYLLFTVATVVYLSTLEPTASYWDSGEFIASAYKLEVPHPPGAPLFLLIGRIFSFFAFDNPDNIALSINALSAISSGLTVMFLYWIIIMLGEKVISPGQKQNQYVLMLSGIAGSLTFAFSDSFWTSATETEVYALSTLLTALVFWAILKWERQQNASDQNKWLLLIAYLMGLSVGIHLLNLLTIPAIALVYYFKRIRKPSIKGVAGTLVLASMILIGILYGLVGTANVAKYFELLFVNGLGLPFGTGALFFILLALSIWTLGVIKSQTSNRPGLNTALLAIGFIYIGYSSYALIPIRSNQGTPINQNAPGNILQLIYYLNMEQYPSRPLLYGHNFDAQIIDQKQGSAVYEQGDSEYEIKDHKIRNIYANEDLTLFPRMYSTFDSSHPDAYRRITGLKAHEKPKFRHRLKYLFSHQLGHMYWRYFLWNFAGKENSKPDADWMLPLETAVPVSTTTSTDAGTNNYYMLPLILGIIGVVFLYFKEKQLLLVIGTLFIMTGLAIVVYVNAPPIEPRARDYVYVGSYFAFSIFIGMGVLSIFKTVLSRAHSLLAASALSVMLGLGVPGILFIENYADHDRSGRYYSVDQARNMLAECEPNAILFTGGDNDTYPLWYVQEVEGFRTDVRVIVLSYSNTDWYIDQLFRKINESEPLPLTLDQKCYKNGGLNDYIPYVPNQRITGPISARQYLQLVKKQSKALQASSGFHEFNTLPADSFYIKNEHQSIQNELPDRLSNMITERIEVKLKGRAMHKNDLVIMDLMDTNRWERPIYFNYTSLNSINLDLSNHVVLQGNTYRLMPLTNKSSDSELIDEHKMYTNLIEKSSWRGLNDAKVYYPEFYKNAITAQRQYFNQLAEILIDTGKVEDASTVLKQSVAFFPNHVIPYDIANVQTTDLLLAVNDTDTASQMAEILANKADAFLHHARQNVHTDQHQITRGLYTLRQLALTFDKYELHEQSAHYGELFTKHYKRLEG